MTLSMFSEGAMTLSMFSDLLRSIIVCSCKGGRLLAPRRVMERAATEPFTSESSTIHVVCISAENRRLAQECLPLTRRTPAWMLVSASSCSCRRAWPSCGPGSAGGTRRSWLRPRPAGRTTSLIRPARCTAPAADPPLLPPLISPLLPPVSSSLSSLLFFFLSALLLPLSFSEKWLLSLRSPLPPLQPLQPPHQPPHQPPAASRRLPPPPPTSRWSQVADCASTAALMGWMEEACVNAIESW